MHGSDLNLRVDTLTSVIGPRGPTQVNREQPQGRTPQNPQKNREQLRPRQLSQNEDSGSDGDMSDQTEPVVPRNFRNQVPRPNSDKPVSNTETKIDQIMDMLHGFIVVRNVNNPPSRGKFRGQPRATEHLKRLC